jgi:hypothetical protein
MGDNAPRMDLGHGHEQGEAYAFGVSRLGRDIRSPETRERSKLKLDINIPKSVLTNLLGTSRPQSPEVNMHFAV